MKAHELATLNEAREENSELKRTCEGLRRQIKSLNEENLEVGEQRDKAEATAEAMKQGLGAVYVAIHHIGGQQLTDAVTAAAKDALGVPAKDSKPNRAIQIVRGAAQRLLPALTQ